MLQDLDSRLDNPDGDKVNKNLFDGLQPVGLRSANQNRKYLPLLVIALFLVSGVALVYAYIVHFQERPTSMVAPVAKTPSTTKTASAVPQSEKTATDGLNQEPLDQDKPATATGTVAKTDSVADTVSTTDTPKNITTTVAVTAKTASTKTAGNSKPAPTPAAKANPRRPSSGKRTPGKANKRKTKTRLVATVGNTAGRPMTAKKHIGSRFTTAKGVTKKAKPATPYQQAEHIYQQAALNMRQNQSIAAERKLRRALGLAPKHIMARELLVSILIKSGRWPEAERFLRQGTLQTPRHYRFAQQQARLAVERGDNTKALKLLEASAPYGRNDPKYAAFLAVVYQRGGQHKKAIDAYGHALQIRPQEGRWWLGAAVSLEAEQQWDSARQAYQRAINSNGMSNKLVIYAQQRLAVLKNK